MTGVYPYTGTQVRYSAPSEQTALSQLLPSVPEGTTYIASELAGMGRIRHRETHGGKPNIDGRDAETLLRTLNINVTSGQALSLMARIAQVVRDTVTPPTLEGLTGRIHRIGREFREAGVDLSPSVQASLGVATFIVGKSEEDARGDWRVRDGMTREALLTHRGIDPDDQKRLPGQLDQLIDEMHQARPVEGNPPTTRA